ncbi:MAG TPA: hypothetical protein VFR68_13280 [Candidatus Dormibacteraeota bacterium]|nr:hypothetical protein [Candidatus Dormibacteraeota bacterium]
MCALDWNGRLRREIPRGLAIRQSPDGSRLLAIDYPILDGAATTYVIVDAENHLIDRMSSIWREEAVWADDNRHLCYIQDSNSSGRGGVASLTERVPAGPSRRVATVGYITYVPQPSNGGGVPSPFVAGPHILSCSVLTDRALVLNPETGVLTTLRLSDGVQVGTHSFGHQFYPYGKERPAEHLVASRDGRYVADNIDGAASVTVLDVLGDRVIARLPVIMLSGFSWDGTRAVVRLNDQITEVIEWQSGRVVRQLAGTFASALARPDSQDFLVGMPSTRHQFGLDLYIVRGDGTAFQVARSVEIIDQYGST